MKMKIFLKILLGLIALILAVKIIINLIIEPWIEKKILATLNDNKRNYKVEIEKVHIIIFPSGIELETITIFLKQEHEFSEDLNVKIASIRFEGVRLAKAFFKNDIDIRNVTLSDARIKGKIPFSRKGIPRIVMPLNIRINRIFFDITNLEIENTLNAQIHTLKEGVLCIYDLQIMKLDTLSPGIFKQFDITAEKFISVSPDSLYSLIISGIDYSGSANRLAVNKFSISPNYSEYDFTSKNAFQTNRIEANFSRIVIHDFNAADLFISRSLIGSYIEIGNTDMKIFRDKRKAFRHVNKPPFQDMIYNYPGAIRIDSIGLKNGNIMYSQHGEGANEPGTIGFNKIKLKIYKITNDTIYRTERAFLELKGNALLQGKSKLTVLFKGSIYDCNNSFSLNGTLSGLEVYELNSILSNNAFISAASGQIDEMNFSFTADNAKAAGKMTLLYHRLDIQVKKTDHISALRERFISFFINRKVMDSNPIPGGEIRVGIIDYERDPERFIISYIFKSLLSGIESTIVTRPKKKNN